MKALRLAALAASTVLFGACAPADYAPPSGSPLAAGGDIPINLKPMYGSPGVVKSETQRKGDELFIETVTKNTGSRQLAAKQFAGEGWREYQKGDLDSAMRRFNQAWLLDPNSFLPYWGFGAVLMQLAKPEQAIPHYERSLSLIDITTEKPRLLNDSAKAYSFGASRGGPTATAWRAKAETLFQQAVQLDPKYSNAYRDWIAFNFSQKEYSKAWEVVKRARGAGVSDLPQDLINALADKMPEPRR